MQHLFKLLFVGSHFPLALFSALTNSGGRKKGRIGFWRSVLSIIKQIAALLPRSVFCQPVPNQQSGDRNCALEKEKQNYPSLSALYECMDGDDRVGKLRAV